MIISRVLLVEDEQSLREGITMNLEEEGYDVIAVANGIEAIKLSQEQRFNLIVLDIMLPDIDGYQVCEHIRLNNTDVPILFLTAKDSQSEKVQGLKKGADDYLTKPFNLEELLLRIKILVKHSLKGSKSTQLGRFYKFGDNEINFITYTAKSAKNNDISLTKKEAKLLRLLIERNNEVVSREQILQYVWGYDVYPTTRTIDNFILAFRKYFETDNRNPEYFHSIRGIGYKFTCEENELIITE